MHTLPLNGWFGRMRLLKKNMNDGNIILSHNNNTKRQGYSGLKLKCCHVPTTTTNQKKTYAQLGEITKSNESNAKRQKSRLPTGLTEEAAHCYCQKRHIWSVRYIYIYNDESQGYVPEANVSCSSRQEKQDMHAGFQSCWAEFSCHSTRMLRYVHQSLPFPHAIQIHPASTFHQQSGSSPAARRMTVAQR